MARYHVRADGEMGVCTAREGNCPYGGEEGTKHFTSGAEARKYSEERVKAISSGKALGPRLRRWGGLAPMMTTTVPRQWQISRGFQQGKR